jgi:hypothetical protein
LIERVLTEPNNELGGRVVTEVKTLGQLLGRAAVSLAVPRNNPDQGYCAAVIGPRIEKFREGFKGRLGE